MSMSFWQADGSQPRRSVDMLVIGAGVVGCAAAYFAAQAGREVVIVDRRGLAMGASGRNAGFFISGLDSYYHRAVAHYGEAVTREMWAISHESIAFWQDRIADSGGAVTYDPCGSLLLSESEAEADEVAQAAHALTAAGIDIIYHDTDPLRRGYFNAIEQPRDGAVNPVELARAVCQQSGAELSAPDAVYKIEQTAADTVTVHAQKAIYEAQHIMICVNGYAPHLHPYFAGKITPTRGQVLVTDPLPTPPIDTCGYSNYGYMYFRRTADNRLLLGGGRHAHIPEEAPTTEDEPTRPVQDTLDAYLGRYFPDVTSPVTRRWAGIMGFSVDGLPLVGTLPHMPRVGFAVGFTGHGLSLGAGTAKRAVAHLLHGTDPGPVDARRLTP